MRNAERGMRNKPGTGYGLIGFPLTHSFSPAFFEEKFTREGIDATYTAFPLPGIQALPQLLQEHPALRGLNVTTPYKQRVQSFLHEVSDDAQAIGAVNCIAIKDGRLSGYNTDWMAFRDSLLPLLRPQHSRALVLGSGGASQAVRYALEQMGIEYKSVSRRPGDGALSYEMLSPEALKAYPLIINTTTLGTLGEGLPALPYEALSGQHLLYDLVYNPPLTPFLQKGNTAGAIIKNGLEMLRLQAEASWRIWQQMP